MNIRDFALKVQIGVQKALGEEVQAQLQEVCRNNGVVLQGLLIIRKDHKISPTIYLDDFYELYENGMALSEVVSRLIGIYENSAPVHPVDMDFFRDFTQVKDRICYKLVNAGKNEELLKRIPHLQFLDMAVCFYYAFENKVLGSGTILVYNTHVEMWNTSAGELLKLAHRNTCRIYRMEVKSMEEILEEISCDRVDSHEFSPEDRIPAESGIPMMVLSNQRRTYGAACILYPGLLDRMAGSLRANLYILPSSVHEVIILPESSQENPGGLKEMVCEVNATQVDAEEVLSDNLYFYDKSVKEVKIYF